MRDKLTLFVGIPVLGLISKQDNIFCHRTQEWVILKSVLEFRWLNETPFLLQVLQLTRRLSRAGWRQSLWIAMSDCPRPDQRSLPGSSQEQMLTEGISWQTLWTKYFLLLFLAENTFCSGDHVSWHSPLDNSESRIQHMLLTEDPQMQPVQTPFGVVTFLQVWRSNGGSDCHLLDVEWG